MERPRDLRSWAVVLGGGALSHAEPGEVPLLPHLGSLWPGMSNALTGKGTGPIEKIFFSPTPKSQSPCFDRFCPKQRGQPGAVSNKLILQLKPRESQFSTKCVEYRFAIAHAAQNTVCSTPSFTQRMQPEQGSKRLGKQSANRLDKEGGRSVKPNQTL